ncbi:hypothetical protein C5167_048878 [Papaver somniferum]|uniref:Uncharacterized protein n=1 Tax=Papaver somniferum TaxID=3469 RepID=A0A4Y7KNC3_PAPSO|nr:hypothetical protein C5167_048878 [Papaver somniferum]
MANRILMVSSQGCGSNYHPRRSPRLIQPAQLEELTERKPLLHLSQGYNNQSYGWGRCDGCSSISTKSALNEASHSHRCA